MSPDEICYSFLNNIYKKVKNIKPDFKIIANMGFYKNPSVTYSKTLTLTKKFLIWNVEFPNAKIIKNNPLYPKTYKSLLEEFSKRYYNLVIYQPFFNAQNPDLYSFLFAIAVSNGLGIYHRNDYLGTNWAFPLKDPIIKFNKYIFKNSGLFYGKNEKCKNISVKIRNDIIYNYYCKKDEIVINLINIKQNTSIFPKLPIEKYLLPNIVSHNENLSYGMHFREKFPPFDSINYPQWHLSGIFLLKIPLRVHYAPFMHLFFF